MLARPFTVVTLSTLFITLFLAIAPPARADLLEQTIDLEAEYQAIHERVLDCPNGECPEASQILEDIDVAEGERADIHAARAALGSGCQCVSLDEAITDLDAIADDVLSHTGGWTETLEREPASRRQLPREAVLEADQRSVDGDGHREDAVPLAD